jgi:hypothetical protein
MKTALLEQNPLKTVADVEGFGETEEERREVLDLLVTAMKVDGMATEHANYSDGVLSYSMNTTKVEVTSDDIWARYESGKDTLRKQAEKEAKKKAEDEKEQAIFGKKLSDYLLEDRGLEKGPQMGKAIGKIKGVMAKNRDKSPEELKAIIDAFEL